MKQLRYFKISTVIIVSFVYLVFAWVLLFSEHLLLLNESGYGFVLSAVFGGLALLVAIHVFSASMRESYLGRYVVIKRRKFNVIIKESEIVIEYKIKNLSHVDFALSKERIVFVDAKWHEPGVGEVHGSPMFERDKIGLPIIQAGHERGSGFSTKQDALPYNYERLVYIFSGNDPVVHKVITIPAKSVNDLRK